MTEITLTRQHYVSISHKHIDPLGHREHKENDHMSIHAELMYKHFNRNSANEINVKLVLPTRSQHKYGSFESKSLDKSSNTELSMKQNGYP